MPLASSATHMNDWNPSSCVMRKWSSSRVVARRNAADMTARNSGAPVRVTLATGCSPAGSGGYRSRRRSTSGCFAGSRCAAAARSIEPSALRTSIRQMSAKSPTTSSASLPNAAG